MLEKQIPGVGRYTAGAIASMAYGVRTPIVDGNVHRVLTRLLALHAPQTAPATIRSLWDKAEALVDALPKGLGKGIAGDWNQGLMELGATVCRPTGPDCSGCPLQTACHAYAEVSCRQESELTDSSLPRHLRRERNAISARRYRARGTRYRQ